MTFKGKPGAALETIIPEWAVNKSSGGCGCSDYARQMDAWGTDGCVKNIEQITDHLVSKKVHLKRLFQLMPEVVHRSVAKRLVWNAIKMSE